MLESEARKKYCPMNAGYKPNNEEPENYCYGCDCMAWENWPYLNGEKETPLRGGCGMVPPTEINCNTRNEY